MTRRHELDPISLTFGLLFTGLGLLFLIGQADQALRLKWVWPLLLFAIGAAILLDVTRGRDRTDQETEPQPQPELDPKPAPEPDRELDPEPDPDPELEPELEPEPMPGPGPGRARRDPEGPVDNREQPR
jgi:hypothetical protein